MSIKPSDILQSELDKNPDIQLAQVDYYDPKTGNSCALGLIKKARGVPVERLNDSDTEYQELQEFYDGEGINAVGRRVTTINDCYTQLSPAERLRKIVDFLKRKGL